ncbi:alanine racemase [Chelatococcus reniformis]|uniref:Alanine racemase n=1 Tax=Chelatococcus reniformis TaxID=1494448 RepID=A0A916TZ36_9HYPH|nr:alanine racemase [Chelatococcus reniformis]GGC46051.1 alanine racemase [Chelatococcus reniformis]
MDGWSFDFAGDVAAPGVLTIDLAALTRNYLALRERLTPARTGAVVKADAYGLGAARVAPALYGAGCRDFFVAHLDEALALKPILAPDARLFVLNGLLPGAEEPCAAAGVIPVLNSLEQVANWSAAARVHGAELPAVLQVDTGMSRLGLAAAELARLAGDPGLRRDLRLLFLISHLASADEPESPQNADQLDAWRRAASAFPGLDLCFANSAGILLGASYHGMLARPGIALYGGVPAAGAAGVTSPVVRLEVRVIQTRTVPAGTRVGYGGSHVTAGAARLATLAAGYADGLPRHLGGRGAAYCGATRLPMVGRISMDSLTVDVTALPPGALGLGSLVEIIGPHQSLEEVAAAAETISYEILTRLGHRYQRRYRPAGADASRTIEQAS